jgi:predicted CXXCH cytochrome family protein
VRRAMTLRRRTIVASGLLFLAASLLLLALVAPNGGSANAAPSASLRHDLTGSGSKNGLGKLEAVQETMEQAGDDQACRLCHGDTDRELGFTSGETLGLRIDAQELNASAHGSHAESALACTDCHEPADYQYPHRPVEAADVRTYQVDRSTICQRCHQEAHLTSHPSGSPAESVVCTDCHGAHDVITAEAMHAGEVGEACLACHTERGVPLTDLIQITQVIRDGLFTKQVNIDYCLACHSQPDLTLTFENGDELSLTIDRQAFHDSVHGESNPWQPLDCTDCHDRYTYPHPELEVESERAYNLERYRFCAECHQRNYEKAEDSVHGDAIADGNLEAAVCTDCHGAHAVPVPDEPRERISHTCEQCHSTIFAEYAQSVHGEALLLDSNLDVPTCIDCHGVHDINQPTTILARNLSPELCARCHGDPDLMAKYAISTDVLETYVATGCTTSASQTIPRPASKPTC